MTKDRLKWVLTGIDYEKVTDWEQNFLESVEKYFKQKGDLSETQEEILERIYREKGR